ncbi:MAG: hypothetical protein ACTSQI_08720 [Candidatus Helarchaeota archaeon]
MESGFLIGLIILSSFFMIIYTLMTVVPSNEQLNSNSSKIHSSSYNWTETEVITTILCYTTESTTYHSIALDAQGNLHLTYTDRTDIDGDVYEDIFYRMRNGTTGLWNTASILISNISDRYATDSAVTVDGFGNIHVVWDDGTSSILGVTEGNQDIFYRYLNKSTGIWAGHNDIYDVLTPSPDHYYDCITPSIAADSDGNVHVVWADNNDIYGDGGFWDIFYRCWNSTWGTWGNVTVISNDSVSGNSYYPRIAVDSNNNLHVAWYDNTNYSSAGLDADIFYKFFNATSGLWSATEVVSTESTLFSLRPSIAVDGMGNAYLVWDDDTNLDGDSYEDIFYKWRNITTGSWSSVYVVSTGSTSYSYRPDIGIDMGGNLYVVWEDHTSGYYGSGSDDDIFYRLWNKTSGTWETIQVVSTDSTTGSSFPKIAVDPSGGAQVVWRDLIASGIYEIKYKKIITAPPARPLLEPFIPNPTPQIPRLLMRWSLNGQISLMNRYITCIEIPLSSTIRLVSRPLLL